MKAIDITKEINRYDWYLHSACNPKATSTIAPLILNGLMGHDIDRREWAYHEAVSVFWHQGTVYEVTGHVVPFLTRMLLLQLNESVLFDISFLLSTFSLSGRGAADGHRTCGEQRNGQAILDSIENTFCNCITFLQSDAKMSTLENVLITLMMVPKLSNRVFEVVVGCKHLDCLAKSLVSSSYKEAWDIFESLDEKTRCQRT